MYAIIPSYTHCTYSIIWHNEQLCIYVNSNLLFNCVIVNGYNNETIYEITDNQENNKLFYSINNNVESLETDDYSYYIEENQLVRKEKKSLTTDRIGKKFFDKALFLFPVVFPICIYAFIHRFDMIKKRKGN